MFSFNIIHGIKILANKIFNSKNFDINLYYRNKLNIDNISLEDLIVLEYNFSKDTIKFNAFGSWNSEGNSIIYYSSHKSINQSIIKELIDISKPDFIILAGDNIYPRLPFIKNKLKINTFQSNDEKIYFEKELFVKNYTGCINTKEYKNIFNNGFNYLKKNLKIPFFSILGNHDNNKYFINYEINQTYINSSITDNKLNINSNWIMPEEFYILKINDWYFFMLNSNSLYSVENNSEKIYQEKLIEIYIEKYKNLFNKNIILCLHELWFGLGHNYSINNFTELFIYQFIVKYNQYIYGVISSDEHNLQIYNLNSYNIKIFISGCSPYAGTDIFVNNLLYNYNELNLENEISLYDNNLLELTLNNKLIHYTYLSYEFINILDDDIKILRYYELKYNHIDLINKCIKNFYILYRLCPYYICLSNNFYINEKLITFLEVKLELQLIISLIKKYLILLEI